MRSTEFSYEIISLPPSGGNLANDNLAFWLLRKIYAQMQISKRDAHPGISLLFCTSHRKELKNEMRRRRISLKTTHKYAIIQLDKPEFGE